MLDADQNIPLYARSIRRIGDLSEKPDMYTMIIEANFWYSGLGYVFETAFIISFQPNEVQLIMLSRACAESMHSPDSISARDAYDEGVPMIRKLEELVRALTRNRWAQPRTEMVQQVLNFIERPDLLPKTKEERILFTREGARINLTASATAAPAAASASAMEGGGSAGSPTHLGGPSALYQTPSATGAYPALSPEAPASNSTLANSTAHP